MSFQHEINSFDGLSINKMSKIWSKLTLVLKLTSHKNASRNILLEYIAFEQF